MQKVPAEKLAVDLDFHVERLVVAVFYFDLLWHFDLDGTARLVVREAEAREDIVLDVRAGVVPHPNFLLDHGRLELAYASGLLFRHFVEPKAECGGMARVIVVPRGRRRRPGAIHANLAATDAADRCGRTAALIGDIRLGGVHETRFDFSGAESGIGLYQQSSGAGNHWRGARSAAERRHAGTRADFGRHRRSRGSDLGLDAEVLILRAPRGATPHRHDQRTRDRGIESRGHARTEFTLDR